MSINSLLIANRGEIAVRIIRAAKELGIHTVQVYSDADASSLAVQLADESFNIGPPIAAESYLNIDAILNAAIETKVDAIHPGYGFLSENADFANRVVEKGLIFVGPDGNSIGRLGDKVKAREIAEKAGVPTVPGSKGRVEDMEEGREILLITGFPAMIKAAAGGGGRGIRVVHNIEDFDRYFPQAAAEAKASFGDGGLYIEKYIASARHVEVQFLGDGKAAVHCFERECSLQRRRQKVWEEAPAQVLTEKVRQKLCQSAVDLATSVSYSGAGTVEFLYDEASGEYYFIEVNTRIQVEHPITEMITGIDLVQAMLRIAGGESLWFKQSDIRVHGHAIECRINAEDPSKNFLPWPGLVNSLSVPKDGSVRFDTLLYSGYTVPPYYDSLLGKLIVWSEDRDTCLQKLHHALNELEIGGIPTTIPFHMALAKDNNVQAGNYNTDYLEDWLESNFNKLEQASQGGV